MLWHCSAKAVVTIYKCAVQAMRECCSALPIGNLCVLWEWALLPSVHQISCWGNTLLLPVSSIYLFPANALVQYTVFSRVCFVILNHLKYMFLKQTTHSYRQCHQGANLTTVPILFWKNFYEDIVRGCKNTRQRILSAGQLSVWATRGQYDSNYSPVRKISHH